MTDITKTDSHGPAVEEPRPQRSATPKWAALVNDSLVPMPSQRVRVEALRYQSSIPADHAVFRDHNSETDPLLADNGSVNLADGNVFYSAPRCEASNAGPGNASPKLAYVINDRWEVVVKPSQTGKSLRDLFALPEDAEILRDLESPDDVVVGDSDDASIDGGCVFRTRHHHAMLAIKVYKLRFTEKDGVKAKMKGREIARLVEPQPDQTRVERITDGGPVPVGLDEEVDVKNCDEFKVIRCNVNAGFQSDRVERELATLRERGAQVSLIVDPVPAVLYSDVPVMGGLPMATTDVLVKIPAGYPGGIIDNAFLPDGSPLLSLTVGSEQQVESIGGRQWKQKSIHPYTGNGVQWNKDLHGFHTYYAELVSWLHARK